MNPSPERKGIILKGEIGICDMKNRNIKTVFLLCLWALAACINTPVQSSLEVQQANKIRFGSAKPAEILVGKASWYGTPFHGRRTANGEIYDMYELTAAHKTLPFGTLILLVNPANQHSLVVRINDRGPYIPGRILDLSYAAAKALDTVGPGVANLWMAIYPPQTNPKNVAMVKSFSSPNYR